MKFSLKTIAAAVVMAAAAASANAAIDNGQNGNGELFFNAWDGVSSYNYDMNLSIDSFDLAKNAGGMLDLSWGADFTSSYSSWLNTANASTTQWSILAVDTSGQRRFLATVGQENALPALNTGADVLRAAATNVQTYVGVVNQILVGNSAVTTTNGAASYAGAMGAFIYNKFNFDTSGNLLANSYADGLVFEKTTANATGLTKGVNTAYVDETVAVRAWLANDNTLHIGAVAAVPEPESYAMLLAGLGMIGFMAGRRNKRG